MTAITLFLRFYSRKSLKSNSAAVFSAASLFLAGKLVYQPISNAHLSTEFFKNYFGRGNPHLAERIADRSYMENYYSTVMEAEGAMLCTLGFDLKVPVLMEVFLYEVLLSPRFTTYRITANKSLERPTDELKYSYVQFLMNLFQDIYRKEGTLLLQYTCRQIVLAAMIFLLRQKDRVGSVAKMLDTPDIQPTTSQGLPWYVEEGLSEQDCSAIIHRFNQIYMAAQGGSTTTSAGAGGGGGEATTTIATLPPPLGATAPAASSVQGGGAGGGEGGDASTPSKSKKQKIELAVAAGGFSPDSEPEEGELDEGEVAA